MTARERFHQTMKFGQVDRVSFYEWIGFWTKTLERWRKEGMPGDAALEQIFGFDRRRRLPVSLGVAPGWDEEILSEDAKTETVRGTEGVVYRRFKDASHSIPKYIRFPIETRDDWDDFKKRLNPKSPCRYPLYWDDEIRVSQGREYPIWIVIGGLFGWIRNWMGIEGVSIALMTDKAWVQEMMEYVADFIIETITPALEQIPDIDFAAFWEDMAYNKGSLIAPKYVKELMVPHYKRITEVLRKHGIDIILLDCDGNHDELTPLWLESGITGVYPLEVAAGEDPVALRKQYGKDLMMIGGIDKRVLARSKDAIKQEVMAKIPWLIEQGGYIPSIDHAVPADVPYENYLYYIGLVRQVIGIV